MDAAERRRHSRIRLDGRMVGRATLLSEFRVVALSEAGGALLIDVPMVVGSRCDLTLQLAHVAVDLRARVVDVRPPEEGQAGYLVAVEFEGIDEIDAGLLASFLDRERRRDS